jgi:hypothetical protein
MAATSMTAPADELEDLMRDQEQDGHMTSGDAAYENMHKNGFFHWKPDRSPPNPPTKNRNFLPLSSSETHTQ